MEDYMYLSMLSWKVHKPDIYSFLVLGYIGPDFRLHAYALEC